MSGDVQPRKRKDKKKKKDELGIEEPRGTSAVFGEGDVFMHSQHDHGTGGHWCAKIIFFFLLAVLVTLIGLIISENRGLTELEANSVESRYSGVFDGWLEDNADDHHDDHTLDLKHHDKKEIHKIKKYVEESSDQAYDDGDEKDLNYNRNNLYHETESDEIYGDNNDNGKDNLNEDDFANNLYTIGAQENDDDDNDDDSDELEDETEAFMYHKTVEQENDGDDIDDGDGVDNHVNNLHQNIDSDEINGDNSDNNNDSDEDDFENNFHETQKHEKDGDDIDDDSDEVDDENENFMYHKTVDKEIDGNDNDDEDDNDGIESHENNLYHKNEGREKYEDQIAEENNGEHYNDNSFYTKKTNGDEENEFSNEYQKSEPQHLEDEDHNDDNVEDNDSGVELERIEREVSDEEPISTELPALPEQEDDHDSEKETGNDIVHQEDVSVEEDNYEEFLESDEEFDTPIVDHITAPAGKPYVEVDEDALSEKPTPLVPDTLAEEEEYEKRQEELRREEEQASHVWLKLGVGTALLAATHYVMRRAVAPRDVSESGVSSNKQKPSTAVDSRMTLIPEEPSTPVTPETELPPEYSQVIKTQDSQRNLPLISKSVPSPIQNIDEEETIDESLNIQNIQTEFDMELDTQDKELYSEDDDVEDEEEELFEERQGINGENIKQSNTPIQNEEEIPDDVEIIDEETLEEEMEEEEISDVDDAELLSRLEAKYGRLPEPERPGQKHKDGGNSVDEVWPGEPSDPYWRQQLDKAEEEFRQGAWSACGTRLSGHGLAESGRARWLAAQALDRAAEQRRDNTLLSQAISAYLHLLKMNERLSDNKLKEVAERTLDRIQFRGTYLRAESVYRLLIRRFPNDPTYRNKLSTSFLMANRADLAEEVIKETLQRWPKDRLALAHYGFILKTEHNRLEEAVEAFQKSLEGDTGPANEPRFYYHLGDSLLLLGRYTEAHEVHKRGAALGHFLSPAQRSLYNVPRLKSKPWWKLEDTPYVKLARALEGSWKEILKEGEVARELYEKEKEGLKERGDWSQLDLFVRGREIANRCKTTPVTCSIVRAEAAASECRRGQVKFSSMAAGTHVRPHVGPTNCRLRMHLGLSNTKDTYLRVDKETRQWTTGKVLLFDDSFEHEVWHNGTGARLVLIVDVWHPDLTPAERRQLPAI